MTSSHLVITRFSVRFADAAEPFPEAWLDDRLRLLEAYCLPSLAAQTCSGFTWLLLCDESTPGAHVERLTALTKEVGGSAVIRTSTARSSLPAVLAHLDPAADVLVTTRLDSDDAVAVDFVERVQSYLTAFRALRSETLLLNFSQGRTLDTRAAALYDSFQPQGPFLSLFERLGPAAEPRTVYSGNHGRLSQEHPLQIDASGPAWLQVVHGQNVSNHVRKIDKPVAGESLDGRFAIRPAAAQALSGASTPHAKAIKAAGEQGTEGLSPPRG
jgi:hypothetical protein